MIDDSWQDTARRFVDPAFVPEWMPDGRPEWPVASNTVFRTWLVDRLDELEPVGGSPGLLDAARVAAIEPHVPAAAQVLHDVLSRINFEDFIKRYADKKILMTKGDRAPTLDEVERAMLNEREAIAAGKKRRGPARGAPTTDDRHAVVRAAQDIWLIRNVIVPRFWPEQRGIQSKLPGEIDKREGATYQKLIAQRYGHRGDADAFAQRAWSEYRKERMAAD